MVIVYYNIYKHVEEIQSANEFTYTYFLKYFNVIFSTVECWSIWV